MQELIMRLERGILLDDEEDSDNEVTKSKLQDTLKVCQRIRGERGEREKGEIGREKLTLIMSLDVLW